MTPKSNVLRIEMITLLLAMMLGNCQPSNQNVLSENKPPIQTEEDCEACADHFMDGTVEDFDSMISCGRKLIKCDLVLTGWDFMAIGFSHTRQMDSSDHYADLLIKSSLAMGDSVHFYSALRSKAMNEYFRQKCPEDSFRKFTRIWRNSTDISQKRQVIPYYISLLHTCKKYQKSLSICTEVLRKHSSELDPQRLSFVYEIMALNYQKMNNSQELACKYLDSSIQIAPIQRTLQRRQETCK